jgi:BirA family biotin operon repressor/biotin-[acetyl-CoA-carboxylase] ligase
MISSLALAIAIEKVLKFRPQLKWPNDVTLNNKKVAGILVDAAVESNQIDYLVICVGINFKIEPRAVTKLIKNKGNFYGVTTLLDEKEKTGPVPLLQTFLLELEQLYNKLMTNNLDGIKREWEKRASTIGKSVTISTPSGQVKGKAIGIDDDGALLVSTNRKIQRFLVGDILHQI